MDVAPSRAAKREGNWDCEDASGNGRRKTWREMIGGGAKGVVHARCIKVIAEASRGMAIHLAKAALGARDAVGATGWNTDAVAKAVGYGGDPRVAKLDVTRRADSTAATPE